MRTLFYLLRHSLHFRYTKALNLRIDNKREKFQGKATKEEKFQG